MPVVASATNSTGDRMKSQRVGDTVLASLHESAQPRHGDFEMQSDTAMTFKVRQQRIVEATGYLDRDEALKAARLTG
jgi:hypothetical protein